MSDQTKYVQMQPTTISSGGSSIGDTSLILSSFLGIDGVALAMTDFGNLAFGTLEPSSATNEEQISFTGITQNGNGTATLTGVSTVLFKAPYTQTSGLAKSHAGGVVFVISNTAGFYDRLAAKADDESITGLWDFPSGASNPTIGNGSYVAPTTNTQIATKKYVDDTAIAGASNASTSVKGIVQLPTQAQADAKTATGSTGAALSITPDVLRATKYNDYIADTGSASTYVIAPAPVVTSYVTGQQFTFIAATANSANSGVSTLAVNGLAQKTIKNSAGGSLVVNDIIVGQVITVVYDGTNFQMLNVSGRGYVGLSGAETVAGVKTFSSSPVAPTPSGATDVAIKSYVDGNPITSTNGTTTRGATTASGAQTITHSLGRTPKKVRITARMVIGSVNTVKLFVSDGVYNGTTNSSVWAFTTNSGTETGGVDNTNGVHIDNGSASQLAIITVDGTNITLTWTYTATLSGGPIQIMWEAQ